MLSDDGFRVWCLSLKITDHARALIEHIRACPPARRVVSSAKNVSGRYPSRKMGVTIQFESHKVELPAIYQMEHDPNVLEFYDQPNKIKLVYPARSGRQATILHTPDFFVIRSDSAGWEEWKSEDELQKLAYEMPNRYIKAGNGWVCPPGERFAEQYGLYYQVRSSKELDVAYLRNLMFLEDYLTEDCPPVPEVRAQAILSIVAFEPGITLDRLLARADGASTDDLYALIASQRVYTDLHASLLSQAEGVALFRDRETAQAFGVLGHSRPITPQAGPRYVDVTPGQKVEWDGKGLAILHVGDSKVVLRNDQGEPIQLPWTAFEGLVRQGTIRGVKPQDRSDSTQGVRGVICAASPADLAIALKRLEFIQPYLGGIPSTQATRAQREWLKGYRRALAIYGEGFVGLLPQTAKRGNRKSKLDQRTRELAEKFIAEAYETLKQQRMIHVYGALATQCDEMGIVPPSYNTFRRMIRLRPRHEQERKRRGPRAAYKYEQFYFELDMTTPRHGDRPFEVGHIDHTQLDLELRCSQTGRNLGRPWVTFLIDAFSRRILALFITFDPPSYRSCMMVLRLCVMRFQRLPRVIVVDGGREFDSVYFEAVLARYECIKKTRPKAKARFGSVIERLFGTANTELVYNLLGNTQITKNVRQVTKSVNPKNHAVWTLPDLHELMLKWAYEVYDQRIHPALHQSPREAFAAGMCSAGERPQRLIAFDEDFRMFTSPSTSKGTAKVEPGRGAKINYIYYWSDSFRHPDIEGRQLYVRYDPFDAGVAYAFIPDTGWVQCTSEHYAVFRGRSEREVMLAVTELRKRNRDLGRSLSTKARNIADLLSEAESHEAVLQQRLRDADLARAHGRPDGRDQGTGRQANRVGIPLSSGDTDEAQSQRKSRVSLDDLEICEEF